MALPSECKPPPPTCSSCIDVQAGQGQAEGQLAPLCVGGTLQDVMQRVPAARPARGDEVCVRGLHIRHRLCIVYTAAPAERAADRASDCCCRKEKPIQS